jgi:hypothetical protein
MVVGDGIIMEVVLVMDHGVLMVVGDRTEVELMVGVAVVKIMVHGFPMGVVEGLMGVAGVIMEVEDLMGVVEDTMEVVEDSMGVVEVGVMGGMELVPHHQVGKIQEEEEAGVGIGVGHLWDGMETRKWVFMAMALLHHLVTEKVSSQEIYFIVINQYFTTVQVNLESNFTKFDTPICNISSVYYFIMHKKWH